MKVMVAIDESDTSYYALQWTIQNLQPSSVITLVHVQLPFQPTFYPVGPATPGDFYPPPEVVESVRKAQSENSTALLSQALSMCNEKMIKGEILILEGDAKEMICEAAEQMGVDLLVVGSRGLGKIKRAFLGSVSDYCAQHAKCPILIVKPPDETTASM